MVNHFFSKKTIYLSLITLAFAMQGWCSCLILGDDEIQDRQYARVYGVLNNFFSINKESIQKLNKEKFFYEENYKNPTLKMRPHLAALQKDKSSYISKEYGTRHGLKMLKTHLQRVNDCLREAPEVSDLSTDQAKRLRGYVVGLWKIAEVLGYGYYTRGR
ncbi:MAG: hypothetical protein BGO77_00480 [Caedibacter sp. 37-49]|mgnify:FL=1|nr:MAG: hypothetical protein BGO77_00480 [Caedibacter sp. 37-49]